MREKKRKSDFIYFTQRSHNQPCRYKTYVFKIKNFKKSKTKTSILICFHDFWTFRRFEKKHFRKLSRGRTKQLFETSIQYSVHFSHIDQKYITQKHFPKCCCLFHRISQSFDIRITRNTLWCLIKVLRAFIYFRFFLSWL